ETIASPYAAPIIAAPDSGLPAGATVLDALNTGKIKKIVVLVINARADAANTLSQSPSLPGIVDMVNSVTSIPLSSTTASVASQMEVLLAQLNAAAGGGGPGDPQVTGLKVYAVKIDFDQLRDGDPHLKGLRAKANNIPTAWTITQENLQVLEETGMLLLQQHPCFQRLLMDMSIPASFIDPSFAKTGCRQSSD